MLEKNITEFNLDDHLFVLSSSLEVINKVYRIQNEEGLGPYSVQNSSKERLTVSCDVDQLTPREDQAFVQAYKPYLREIDRWESQTGEFGADWFLFFNEKVKDENDMILFAFSSLDQMKNWFRDVDELRKFHDHGLFLAEIIVNKAWTSEHQAVFLQKDIIQINKIPLFKS